MMNNNNNYSPIRESNQEGKTSYYPEEEQDSSIFCACFRFPCFQSKENEANSLLQENNRDSSSSSSSWMLTKMKDLKEYSEVVAGPKWKNMVRKIGKYFNNPKKKPIHQQFRYDSDSYALNFDNAEDDDADGLFRNFSSRFAAPFSGSVTTATNNNNNNNHNQNRNAGL